MESKPESEPEPKIHTSYIEDYSDWYNITSFSDALKLNMEFLKGFRNSTPYHGAPIYDVDVSKLIHVHKNRIFTEQGQSNECVYNEIIPKRTHIYIEYDLVNNKTESKERTIEQCISSTEQKSYLEGYMEENRLLTFLEFLQLHKNEVGYRVYDINKKKLYANNNKRTWLTRDKFDDDPWENSTNLPKIKSIKDIDIDFYEDILRGCKEPLFYFFIFSLKPCDLIMEDLLIDYIELLKAPYSLGTIGLMLGNLKMTYKYGSRKKQKKQKKSKKK